MANKTAGIVNITIQFESGTTAGFGKFSEGVQDETRLLLDRLTALGVRGVSVLDSDVVVGQSFVLIDSTEGDSAADVDEPVAVEPTEAPKRRGRPPGTKNKPKVEAEAEPTPAPKRGPKGPKRRA